MVHTTCGGLLISTVCNGFAVFRMDYVNVTDSIKRYNTLIVPLSTYPRELTILESETALVGCDLLQLGT